MNMSRWDGRWGNARRQTECMIEFRRLLLFAICWLFSLPALAEKRVALVIGNSAYKHAPALANPKNDAEGMAAAPKRRKFDIILGVGLDEAGMRRPLQQFTDRLIEPNWHQSSMSATACTT